MVDTFGWTTINGHISFRHTIKGTSKRGFVVNDTKRKITITNQQNTHVVPYWEHDTILNAGGRKISRLIVVSGKANLEGRKVVYRTATAYWDLKLSEIFEAMQEGIIRIDFDAVTNEGRGSSIRNHGTK